MATLVFMLHFEADMADRKSSEFIDRLGLTMNRVDDWDRLVGFRLVGESGAIRLFLSPKKDAPDRDNWYDLTGTATEQRDRESLANMYDECVAAVRLIGGRIDEHSAVQPPGISVTGPSGSDQPKPIP